MDKVKKVWKKLEYWQRGALIGISIGLFPLNEAITSVLVPINDIILRFPRILISFEISTFNFYLMFIYSIVQWYLLGALIGLIIGKVKKK